MDGNRFDQWVHTLGQARSRRRLLGLLAAGLGAASAMPQVESAARSRKKRKHCPTGLTRCGGKCVDLNTNGQHCGSCNANCTGLCCTGTCVFPLQDPNNCGQCGQECSEAEECVNGSCQGCPLGQTRCTPADRPSYCADLSSDPNNCKTCGNQCAVNEVCRAGQGNQGIVCSCDGPSCPTNQGERCCPATNGVCCADGRCCRSGQVCQPGDQCCDAGSYLCDDGVTCCPEGTACTGGGQCESSVLGGPDRPRARTRGTAAQRRR